MAHSTTGQLLGSSGNQRRTGGMNVARRPRVEDPKATKPARAETRTDRLYVQSVGKAFRLLEAFADGSKAMSLSQLAKGADIDKSGAQRLAHTLEKLGYLERDAVGFRPGR